MGRKRSALVLDAGVLGCVIESGVPASLRKGQSWIVPALAYRDALKAYRGSRHDLSTIAKVLDAMRLEIVPLDEEMVRKVEFMGLEFGNSPMDDAAICAILCALARQCPIVTDRADRYAAAAAFCQEVGIELLIAGAEN
jgi:hypothetical protein